MKYYFFRLNSPRPTFLTDMTPDEAALMKLHADYWRVLMDQGKIVALGPVADPRHPFGIGIIRLDDKDDPQVLVDNDPVVRAEAGFSTDLHPMPRIMLPGG